ncbi:MAG: bacillithiol biosynthesis cysteine-adding enzyme BshC [Flavobacteriales bacterium]|nr:bacillithiol biosynthesis cysteine-adding enzyme BshC [Flavobacteriales bacterium]
MSRFKLHKLPVEDTQAFSSLVIDYAKDDEKLRQFYGLRPDAEVFEKQMKAKSHFDSEHRYTLVKALTEQYGRLKNVQVDSDRVEKNVIALEHANTFTVTTGHQLNLFTGPLYFWYKIVHAINLARHLKNKYPEYDFVPVYWMATEDHDFDEINHINLFGGTPRWDRPDGGAVGRMDLEGFADVLNDLSEVMGPGANAGYLKGLFERAYTEQSTLADATRYLVHEFFAEDGLVIVDGDEPSLKALFGRAMEREMKEKVTFNTSISAVQSLERYYHVQVNPREINLFYLDDRSRQRLEANDIGWHVVDRDKNFTPDSFDAERVEHPERFSPNVLMRPLYQEVILPNLAYIGGGAEVAYWMELKASFDEHDVPFPVLFLRNSALLISDKNDDKRQRLGIGYPELFQPTEEIVECCVSEHSNENLDFSEYRSMLEEMFGEMEEIARRTEKSFDGAVKAQRQKQLNGLDKLHKRLVKAEKRKHEQLAERIRDLKMALFSKGKLQERHDNFIPFYLEYGDEFKTGLIEHLDPFTFDFHILTERSES